jgi:hypothetical protein
MLGQGNLQEATGADEIIGKMWCPWITAPRGTGDAVPALAEQRVIQQGHHGAGGRQGFQHAIQWDPPESLGIETLAFK